MSHRLPTTSLANILLALVLSGFEDLEVAIWRLLAFPSRGLKVVEIRIQMLSPGQQKIFSGWFLVGIATIVLSVILEAVLAYVISTSQRISAVLGPFGILVVLGGLMVVIFGVGAAVTYMIMRAPKRMGV